MFKPVILAGFADAGHSLADAKPTENLPQQIVGAKLPGDRVEGLLRESQLFCQQFQRRRFALQVARR